MMISRTNVSMAKILNSFNEFYPDYGIIIIIQIQLKNS